MIGGVVVATYHSIETLGAEEPLIECTACVQYLITYTVTVVEAKLTLENTSIFIMAMAKACVNLGMLECEGASMSCTAMANPIDAWMNSWRGSVTLTAMLRKSYASTGPHRTFH